jgi:Ca2+-binding RTX toxin-like protein
VTVSSPIVENDIATLTGTITDPDPAGVHTVVIDWGAGEGTTTLTLPAGVTSFSATHQYLDDDPTGTAADAYSISVTAIDSHGATGSAVAGLTVQNASPVLGTIALPADIRAGELISGTVSYTDVGSLDTHTVSINWGDGSTTSGTAAGGAASGSHAYASGGIYTVTMTVTDDDTSSAFAVTTAYVTGVGTIDGQLQVIGTSGDDHVSINLAKSGGSQVIRVHASFLPAPGFIDVSATGISSMVVMLLDGNDHASIAGNISLPALLDGGAGNDHLNAGGGGSVVHGGSGDDVLLGGAKNDILIGGTGADQLNGGSGQDILIGGTTAYDTDRDALFALLAEWNSTRTRAARITNLRTGAGPVLAGRKLQAGTTVFHDGAQDQLTGGADLDWYFGLIGEDLLNGFRNDETLN